jgi:hypothetical protein
MTTCILHLIFACHYVVVKTDFRILSQRRAVTWIPLPTTQCARSHGVCPPANRSALSRRATRLGTRVGSELGASGAASTGLAAQAGSPSNRVTDTPMAWRSISEQVDNASTVLGHLRRCSDQITYPPTGPLTAMTRSADGQHQPATPVGRQIDFTTTSLAQRHKDCTGEVPWPGK